MSWILQREHTTFHRWRGEPSEPTGLQPCLQDLKWGDMTPTSHNLSHHPHLAKWCSLVFSLALPTTWALIRITGQEVTTMEFPGLSRSVSRALVQLLPLWEIPAVLVGHLEHLWSKSHYQHSPLSAPLCTAPVQGEILIHGLGLHCFL